MGCTFLCIKKTQRVAKERKLLFPKNTASIIRQFIRKAKHQNSMKKLPFSLLFLLATLVATAQPADYKQFFNWLSEFKTPPELFLKVDLKALQGEEEPAPWFKAELKVNDSLTMPLSVQARGKMRRNYCQIPPLRFQFAPATVPDSISEWSETKVVLSCYSDESHEKLVLQEYLCYKLYNLITDHSYRVVLVNLQLQSTSGKEKPSASRYAFLIEPSESMVDRLKGRSYRPLVMQEKLLDSTEFVRMSLFQYMVGNTDWSAETGHNIRVVARKGGSFIPVAYDFDYAGIVNAPYAVPQKGVPIQKVTERYYNAPCQHADQVRKLLPEFRNHSQAMYDLIDGFTALPKAERKYMRQYLEEFFASIRTDAFIDRYLLKHCQQKK